MTPGPECELFGYTDILLRFPSQNTFACFCIEAAVFLFIKVYAPLFSKFAGF